MTTKYERPDFHGATWRARGTPYLRQQIGNSGMTPRGRGFLIVLSTLMVLCLLTVVSVTIRSKSSEEIVTEESAPLIRGEAVVTGKGRDASGNFQLHLRVVLEGEQDVEAVTLMEEEFWAAFQPGDRVAVLYERSGDTGALLVRECGLVALSSGNP
jgi:hypothetical protein